MYPIRTGKEFINRGYKVYGLCVAGTQVAQGMQEVGIKTFEVSGKGHLIFKELPKLNRWLIQNNISLIHCHKSGDILISALLNLFSKRKTFFTEHMGVTRPKKDLYHKLAYSHVDKVFSISEETYKRNIRSLPVSKNKITRLWLGTDIPSNPEYDIDTINKIKDELKLPKESIVLGNIGRVCSGKGQMELLEAFSLLQHRHPTLHLLIVGGLDTSEGSDNLFVQQIKDRVTKLSLDDRVHFTGFRKDTERMLAVMEIVCLPNHNEAFGLTAIEAMAYKKAIVCSNTGALPEILGHSAILCNPLEPDSISQGIEQYVIDPKLKQNNAKLAHERALAEFSTASHISSLERFYQS
ncbi:glycosyl transferase group 1 [Vibrio coralliilyticus]|uniref:Glycosyl transferase group 1 n=2 Tax=Vibrio coralliilyticus TaxID=190893 RepID=A0A837G4X3_9VIBR|nr:glycosyl transferase group 1 [Vibrio coralliilyticus]QOU31476.1 glycosyltransferase family 4 protein [Vibrio coralliilyticus]